MFLVLSVVNFITSMLAIIQSIFKSVFCSNLVLHSNSIVIYENENYIKPDNRNRFNGAGKAEINLENNMTKIMGQFFNDETRKSYGTISIEKNSD